MIDNTEILRQILTLCSEQQSGTLFLVTRDNKACHIVFDQGRITGMSFGAVKGAAVAELLGRLVIERCVFNSGTQLPLTQRALVEPETDIFSSFGLRRRPGQHVPEKQTERIYRGHKVTQEHSGPVSPGAETAQPPAENIKPKTRAKRIYRGHVIED
ncbi:hypothetical protein MPL1_10903 [Methylophaga lonarensis MPL]|uniref:DUF4388 domain-containing protein n=1 Tax=Methylophaga lonarensis MPL TaxID=1286106 RepID=M7PEM7_9GAMM|nr:hypothetical protein [Methylophaga lonarensis]EMR12335.1 hypothetical protein MPL1_10903 [Methylophaga lonarensis MPL]